MAAGLRERKKTQTRLAISDIATRLFATRGFDAVTITEVAQAAGVAKMTVTNYFPRKEDLVFDRAEGIVRGLAAAVAGRAEGESLLTAVRRDYAEAVARREVTLGISGPEFARMVEDSPVLTGRLREILEQRERALAVAIAAEAGAGDLLQQVVAAQLASVHRVLYADAARRSLAGESRAQIQAALAAEAERAFDLLEPSLGSYGIRAASCAVAAAT
jgi:AcrR family transcriptional regulator